MQRDGSTVPSQDEATGMYQATRLQTDKYMNANYTKCMQQKDPDCQCKPASKTQPKSSATGYCISSANPKL